MTEQRRDARVSIVTAANQGGAAYGRLPELWQWFDGLCNQTLPAESYEVVVVDGVHTVDYEAALSRFRAASGTRANVTCRRIERAGRLWRKI